MPEEIEYEYIQELGLEDAPLSDEDIRRIKGTLGYTFWKFAQAVQKFNERLSANG